MHADTDTGADVTARALARIEAARGRADAATPEPWVLWTGSSWRRIGSEHGEHRTVIEPTTHPADRHPDLIIRGEDAEFVTHARADVPLLAAIAAAAVRLVAAISGDRVYRPWWGAEADDVGQCRVACQRAVLFGEAWSDIDHQPDCAAMQLDAAIRAAGEAGHV